ncbi:MAG: TetR/AcrR family transcriptional regulator [Acidobacteriaceae bacterium]|nr:TetR/AcrR family transcriptional regulator [Acidobacteriaceae bacterium]
MSYSGTTLSVEERLLASGKKLFATKGFENTTTSAIARDAGTSESQLVKYFGSKEGLLLKIFDIGWAKLAFVYTAASVSTTPLESLRVIFELLVKMLTEDRELRDLMLFEGRRLRSKGPDFILTEGLHRMYDEVTKLVAALLKGSELEKKLRPRAIASGFIGMLESMLRDQAISERKTGQPDPTPDEIRSMFQIFAASLRERAKENPAG